MRGKRFYIFIATGFGSGFSPFAPGTAGAIVAWLIWWALSFVCVPELLLWLTVALVLLFTALGVWSSDALEPLWGKDPSRIVVDEMVGTWIALLAVPFDGDYRYLYAVAAWALFRLFDIFKPLGIRKMESLKGGIGVMMDDILAGVYSFVVLLAVRWWLG